MKVTPIYILQLRAAPGVDPIRELRLLLRTALRRHGFRCLAAHEQRPRTDIAVTVRVDLGGETTTWRRHMAIGKRKVGGENTPLLKYDARVGRIYTQDRVYENGEWQSEQADVTDDFRSIIDLENLEVGWIAFPKREQPRTKLVPAGKDIGEPPDDGLNYKEGVRLFALLDGDTIARELLTSAVLWNAVDDLHDTYLAERGDNPGEVPVAELADVQEVKNATGDVSYQPVFEIVDWVPRPEALPATVAPRPPPKPAKLKPKPVNSDRGDMDDEIPSEGGESLSGR